MKIPELRRGFRRLTSLAALTALAGGALTMGLVAPAQAVDNVSGSVVDSAGNPAQGFVFVYDDADNFLDSEFVQNGHIGLELPAGSYKFEFSPSSPEWADEFYLNKPNAATADVVVVGAGATVLAPWTIDRQPFVTGKVTDSAGRPIGFAEVQATDATDNSFAGEAFTDENGAFTLPVFADANTVKLEISAEDFATEFYNDKPTLATADVVAATAAGANVGSITLTAGGSFNGVVTSDAGVPLELIAVLAENVVTGVTTVDRTDKTGSYSVQGLRAGSYVLRYSDDYEGDFRPAVGEYASEYFDNVATEAAATPVPLGKDQAFAMPKVTLTPKPFVAPASAGDITGAVTDASGAGIAGVAVSAFGTPAVPLEPEDRNALEETVTNRAGLYSFNTLDQVPNENQFKIEAEGFSEREETTFGARTIWYRNSISFENADVVTLTGPVGGVNIVMEYNGGVSGTVSSEVGLSVTNAFVVFYDNDGRAFDFADVKSDGTYETRALVPGSYKALFSESEHVSEWWDDALVEDAKTVVVKTNALTGGINAALSNVLKAVERPEITKYPWVGSAITADKGRWNQEGGSKFTYEWLANGVVVATGESFVPSASLIGKKLSLRVTNQNGKLKASATSVQTLKVGLKSKVKAKAEGTSLAIKVTVKGLKAKKVKGTVIVREIVGVKDNGELKLKKVGKAKVKKGKASVSLAKLEKDKAKDKLLIVFKGKPKSGSTEITKKVKR